MSDLSLFPTPGGPAASPAAGDPTADLVARANQEIQECRDSPPTPESLRHAAIKHWQIAAELEAWADRLEAQLTARSCPACGAPLPPDAKWCPACSTPTRTTP